MRKVNNPPPPQEIHRLGPMDLKIYSLEKKPTTVTRQLKKSRDFRHNYLCDFHLGVNRSQHLQSGVRISCAPRSSRYEDFYGYGKSLYYIVVRLTEFFMLKSPGYGAPRNVSNVHLSGYVTP